MNGYEIVADLIKRGRNYINEGGLKWAADDPVDAEIAALLLVKKHNGRYVPAKDKYSCGGYYFENPLTKS